MITIEDIPYEIINSRIGVLFKSDYIIVGTVDNQVIILKEREVGNIYTSYQTLGETDNLNPEIGHTYSVTSVDVSGNGNTIVSASVDETIKIWRRKMNGSYALFQTLSYDSSTVDPVRISPDGTTIISGNMDKILIWTRQDELNYTFAQRLDTSPAFVETLEIIGNGEIIVSGCNDKTLILWLRQSNGDYVLHQRLGEPDNIDPDIGHTNSIKSVNIVDNTNTIVSGSMDTTIIIWTQINGIYTLFQRLGIDDNQETRDEDTGHIGWVLSTNVTNNGNTIISGSADTTLIIWLRQPNGEYILHQRLGETDNLNPEIGHTNLVTSTSVINNGEIIVSSSIDEIIIWVLQEGGFYIIRQVIPFNGVTTLKTFSRNMSRSEIIRILADRSDSGVNKSRRRRRKSRSKSRNKYTRSKTSNNKPLHCRGKRSGSRKRRVSRRKIV